MITNVETQFNTKVNVIKAYIYMDIYIYINSNGQAHWTWPLAKWDANLIRELPHDYTATEPNSTAAGMPTGLRTLTPFPSMGTRLGTFPRHWEHSEGMSLTPCQGYKRKNARFNSAKATKRTQLKHSVL